VTGVTLATRLWLSGALLPVLVMAAVLFGADRVFVLALERSLDQALLAQAAVESVSLFDGPRGEPHLHMAISPLVESVRGFAPEGVLFGPDGAEVMHYPPLAVPPSARERCRPGTPGAPPVLTTREKAGVRERTLEVTVASPAGQPYMLRLTANMAQVDASQATLHRLSLAALALIALVLAAVQGWQGRSLRRRLSELSAHAEALRAGDLDHSLAPERQDDEIAVLRRLTVQATTALKQARDGKERLLADAAHELRSPLTLMRTSLDLALRKERSVAELKTALSDTRDEVDRLALLATRLLDSAALAHRSGPPELCDLSRLLGGAIDAARPEAEQRGLQLSASAPAGLAAWLRPHAVRQALDNLLSNALKYAAHTISVDLAPVDGGVVVCVSDDGPGIPRSEHELVFEPFHRVQHGGVGAGLGLAIVREVAHAHQGRAYVRPTPRGAALVLELKSSIASGAAVGSSS
jgi:signal transduction histidine kinase